MTKLGSRKRSLRQKRGGIATVECAFCLPLIIAITFATIDLCSAMFLKESLTIAAYEGSRVGVQRGGTNSSAETIIKGVLDLRGITYDANSIQISSPGFEDADTLEHVIVKVVVPCRGNMALTGAIFKDRTLEASVTMRKEFAN